MPCRCAAWTQAGGGGPGGRNSPPGGVWGEAPEASDDLYLLQPIVQWKMLFLHSVEHSTLCNKLAGTNM